MGKETYLALLRGVNVGGKNMLPMKDLTALFATAGCDDVRTYIQSGIATTSTGRNWRTVTALFKLMQG